MAWVDADHLCSIFACQLDEVIAVGAVAHFSRVPAPHDDVAAVEPILALVAGHQGSINGGGGDIDCPPRVGVVDTETTPKQVHQAASGVRAVELVVAARPVRHKQGFVAIFLFNPLHLPCDKVESFLPCYAHKFAFPAPSYPFERVQETVRMVLPAQVGAATCTGTQLRC